MNWEAKHDSAVTSGIQRAEHLRSKLHAAEDRVAELGREIEGAKDVCRDGLDGVDVEGMPLNDIVRDAVRMIHVTIRERQDAEVKVARLTIECEDESRKKKWWKEQAEDRSRKLLTAEHRIDQLERAVRALGQSK